MRKLLVLQAQSNETAVNAPMVATEVLRNLKQQRLREKEPNKRELSSAARRKRFLSEAKAQQSNEPSLVQEVGSSSSALTHDQKQSPSSLVALSSSTEPPAGQHREHIRPQRSQEFREQGSAHQRKGFLGETKGQSKKSAQRQSPSDTPLSHRPPETKTEEEQVQAPCSSTTQRMDDVPVEKEPTLYLPLTQALTSTLSTTDSVSVAITYL